jgi:hypothetical protein
MSPAAEVGNVAMEGHKRFLCNAELCICQLAMQSYAFVNKLTDYVAMETQQCVLFSIVVEAKHFVMPIPSAIVTT